MNPGKLQDLVSRVDWALAALGVPRDLALVEATAVAVYQAMGTPGRRFHTLEHVFSFDLSDPTAALAVLFHDTVYWGLDQQWPQPFAASLGQVAADPGPLSRLAAQCTIPHYRDLLALFGAQPGGLLPAPGTNELFSALALSSVLGSALGRDTTLAAAACIEATIPFRGPLAAATLHGRLGALGYPGDQADSLVARAVTVAAQDLADFRHADPAAFLSGTWRLLPELNPALRLGEQFTVRAYRQALVGMEAFFRFLTPEILFPRWKNTPSEGQLGVWEQSAGRNLGVARDYLGAKLLAAALLEAAALATGGDVPLPLFMGGVAELGKGRLEDHLPPPTPRSADPVYRLLAEGRRDESSFDLKDSPLAAALYGWLTPSDYRQELDRMRGYFAGTVGPTDYLRGWNPRARDEVLRALAAFVPTRRDKLAALDLG